MPVLQLAGSVVIRPKIARTPEIVWQLKVDLKLSSNEFGKLMKMFLWHSILDILKLCRMVLYIILVAQLILLL